MLLKKCILRRIFFCSPKRLFVQVETIFQNRVVIFQSKIRLFLPKNQWKTQTVTCFWKELFSSKHTSGCVECDHIEQKSCSKMKIVSNLSPRMFLRNVFLEKTFLLQKDPINTWDAVLTYLQEIFAKFQKFYVRVPTLVKYFVFFSRSFFPSKRSSVHLELSSENFADLFFAKFRIFFGSTQKVTKTEKTISGNQFLFKMFVCTCRMQFWKKQCRNLRAKISKNFLLRSGKITTYKKRSEKISDWSSGDAKCSFEISAEKTTPEVLKVSALIPQRIKKSIFDRKLIRYKKNHLYKKNAVFEKRARIFR